MSREEVLSTIKRNKPDLCPLPEPSIITSNISPAELIDSFKNSLEKVGAQWIELKGAAEVSAWLLAHYNNALIFENPEVFTEYSGNIEISKLNSIETACLTGQLGVAENGAIWLDESNFPNRIIPFISQRVVIKLAKAKLVENINDAYAMINMKGQGFGVFISGPSKTADIEQSLVYGAHGPKELIVLIY